MFFSYFLPPNGFIYTNAKHLQNYYIVLYHILSSLTNFTVILCKEAGKRVIFQLPQTGYTGLTR
ncbi:MAG: hypothetical protein A3J92_02360 [Planctomycetes bacterium RIFOXYC2_FULL_41_27]|nr:MAG: hypothetical protein A2094_01865 [Planctomycetes bacterium GWE2_41_14]OHC05995.1 MAG: hypothetical protein A3J92_02360 [Planctomycetes bacterium RIFOXYC2_FULL_41_27]